MSTLNRAKEKLLKENYTCVLIKEDSIFCSRERGVKPLVQFVLSKEDFKDYFAADKVIGKATAFLYCILQVKKIYVSIISKVALDILVRNSIEVEYDLLVDNIRNRKNDGLCPFEEAVLDVEDSKLALEIILSKMKEMNISI
ncbi:MAG: DUF1893 domain-containing protein [Erysipelotrichaceae bacterium]|nr:DUF1893 domain-containing protein [Erysipelotrichaceae bacterium]